MNNRIGMAVVGSGYWGINYVRLFSQMSETEMVVVVDPREERLQEVKRRFPDVKTTTDLDNALQMEGVDAVTVCTPATTHFSVTRQCLEADKHVLVEKPMATISEDAEALVQIADAKGLKLMVGHIFLYNAGVRKVRSFIERDELGRIYYLHARRTNLGPIRSDVNALWDLASHDVSIFNYLLSSAPIRVSAVGGRVLRQACCEDVAFLVLTYPNGVLGHIHVSWADPNKEREMVIVGSDKRVVFNDLNSQEPVRIFEKGVASSQIEPASFGEYKFLMRDGDIISPHVEVSEPLRNQCVHFVNAVLNDNVPLTDAINGLEVVRVLEAADRSIELNGTPIDLNWDTMKRGNNGYQNEALAGAIR